MVIYKLISLAKRNFWFEFFPELVGTEEHIENNFIFFQLCDFTFMDCNIEGP